MKRGNRLDSKHKRMSFFLIIFCILGFGALTKAQTQTPDQSANQRTGVAAIEDYCKQIDAFKKNNPNGGRFFGNVSSWDQSGVTLNAPSPKWKEFKSRKARESAGTGDNLFDVADIWFKDEKVVLADLWFGSPSGDWSQSVTYYFRDDGTLAKMRSTFAGFNLNPFGNAEEFGARLVQTRIYDANGKRLSKRLQCFELGEKGRQKKCSGDYSRYEGPVYLKVQSIPIYRLLNSRSLNDVASIKAYARSLDTFAKRNPNRAHILANVLYPNQETYPIPRDAPRYWKEFPTRKAREAEQNFSEAYDGAQVWRRNGKVVLVQIAPNQNHSGDELVFAYYFREDGSLAKTRSKFFDYGLDGDVVKEVIYDVKGTVLDTRMQCVQTNDLPRPRIVNCSKASSSFTDDAPLYKKVEELPFNDLLNEQS